MYKSIKDGFLRSVIKKEGKGFGASMKRPFVIQHHHKLHLFQTSPNWQPQAPKGHLPASLGSHSTVLVRTCQELGEARQDQA